MNSVLLLYHMRSMDFNNGTLNHNIFLGIGEAVAKWLSQIAGTHVGITDS